MLLYAPLEYWMINGINPETNGCGTGGWKNALVPEKLFWLSVTPACNIHDWMYSVGKSHEDKEAADRVFMNNMVRLINAQQSCWLIRFLRLHQARIYYDAVKFFGGSAFWAGKNLSGTMQ